MEKVLNHLLGLGEEEETRGRAGQARMGEVEPEDSSESDSDDGRQIMVETVLTKHVLQRPCGASFGPNGE